MTNTRQLILSFIQSRRRLTLGLVATLLLSNLLNVMLPLSIGLFYETAWHTNSTKGALLQKIFPFINSSERFFAFFALLIALKCVFHFLEKYGSGVLGEQFSKLVRETLFARQLQAPLAVFEQKPTGNYLLRYSGDMTAVRDFLNRGMLQFTGDMFFLLISFVALFLLQSSLAAWVLGLWFCFGTVVFLLSQRLQASTLTRRGQRSKGLAFVSERLHALYSIKSFNRERPEIECYERESRRLYRFGIRFFRFQAIIQALFPVFFYGTLGIVLWQAWAAQQAGQVNTGDLFAFILLLLHLHTVLQRVLEVNLVWQSGMASLGKLSKLLNYKQELRQTGGLPDKIDGRIRFEQVSFAYRKSKDTINNLTLEIAPNSITWLQGDNTVGKSTVFRLIQYIDTPASGRIFIDDTDLTAVTPFEVRKHVAIVSAAVPLLGKTVFQAISYNDTPERREAAIEMLEKLKCTFGDAPAESLDFRLQERARNLSSGQIALLQIARALLTRKKILLLDNPFADLDNRQSARVVRILNRLKSRHTIVITARRLPTRLEVDHQISLDSNYDTEDIAPDTADPDA